MQYQINKIFLCVIYKFFVKTVAVWIKIINFTYFNRFITFGTSQGIFCFCLSGPILEKSFAINCQDSFLLPCTVIRVFFVKSFGKISSFNFDGSRQSTFNSNSVNNYSYFICSIWKPEKSVISIQKNGHYLFSFIRCYIHSKNHVSHIILNCLFYTPN